MYVFPPGGKKSISPRREGKGGAMVKGGVVASAEVSAEKGNTNQEDGWSMVSTCPQVRAKLIRIQSSDQLKVLPGGPGRAMREIVVGREV